MSIAARFSVLLAGVVLLIGVLAAVFAAQREFAAGLADLTLRTQARLTGNPGLQFFIYKADGESLQRSLQPFLESGPVTTAQAFDGLGELITTVKRPGSRTFQPAPFPVVRRDLLSLDSGVLFFDSDSGAREPVSLLRTLLNADAPLYLSLPVLTEANTGAAGLSAADFASALVSGSGNDSQRIAGYIHVLADPGVLNAPAVRAGAVVLLLYSGLALVCALATWFLTQKITRPLRELAGMADAVAAGEISDPIQVDGSGELQDIARLFNSVIEGIKDSQKVMETDRRLLSLKVQERSSQLTQRDAALSRAVEEANETRDQLQHLANYDSLTNLPNRRLFTEQLELLLKLNQRHGHTLALLFIDVDDFKRVNDSLGISAGDQMLVEVGTRLASAVRDSDSIGFFTHSGTGIDVARLGGDEFTVILNQLDAPESATIVARRLIASLTQPLEVDGHRLSLQPTMGIAIAPTDGKDVESLLKAASTARHHAARSGSDERFAVYRSNMGQQGAERLRLESDLRQALQEDGLSLHYQPQVDTNSGSVVGAEALLRWTHPQLGDIPPGRFVSLAEDAGMMNELGDWVLRKACRQVSEFNREGVKLGKVAINISAEQFSPAFVDSVRATIDETGIDPGQLELGLTEAVMSSNAPETVSALRSLKESGIYLSVDDFGTGYSPLNYLSQYPLDELKIDRSFLLEAGRSKTGANLVVAIIAMAHSLGLRVLATGVETESQFHFLTAHGASLIQGYLFSKPVSAEALKPMLSPWHFVDQLQSLAAAAAD
ncbi:EAL domain-containing protein [Pseudohalioglobus sediminis]|uniref:EAL domain-containing protein n=1 Tax=Pseudohalioglobus sediminis TaxID=2606449 RepID=A0A5B0X1R9_9GAMM|nr:bifunctional diguanylate cyclase/phosphodiesterase [Pseudohalioglobus sediminis]KAA1193314.1 EAL domain-containing protein [Pseudohalioglobus sediminis]